MGCSESKPQGGAQGTGPGHHTASQVKSIAQVAPESLDAAAQRAQAEAAQAYSAASSQVTTSAKAATAAATAQGKQAWNNASGAASDAARDAANQAQSTATREVDAASAQAQQAASSVRGSANAAASQGREEWQNLGSSATAASESAQQAASTAAGQANAAAAAAAQAAQDAVDSDDEGGTPMTVLLTARRHVDGRRCVITIGQRTDGGGVLARVFHPASELQYDLTLTPEDLRDSLPEEILGHEHEVDQLNYIRDNLRMAGPSDCRRVELIPAQGESLNVLLRDRRIVGGKMAHITIGLRQRDGVVVVRAFNPATETERELALARGQLRALLPSELHGEESELEQLHWISHNLHYIRKANGLVELKLVPPESLKFANEVSATATDTHMAAAPSVIDLRAAARAEAQVRQAAANGSDSEEEEEDHLLSMTLLFRNQVRVAGKRLFVTIYRRKDTLVVRALNPAAQRETELVLPVQQLPRLLPAELLSEERETDMLKHIANHLYFKTGRNGRQALAVRGEQASPRSGDASGAIAEGDESKNDDEDDDRAELHHLLRDRRTLGGIKVYLSIGRRDGVLVINVYSPSRSADVDLELPVDRLVYLVPAELLQESAEADLVNNLADRVEVDASGTSELKVSIKGAPPAIPDGDADAVTSESVLINGEDHTVTAQVHGDVLVVHAYHIANATTTTMTASLRAVRVELQTGTAEEQALVAEDKRDELVAHLLARLEYVDVPVAARKLEIVGVTGAGAVVERGFSKTVEDAEGDMVIVSIGRSTDMKSMEVSTYNTTNHNSLKASIPMDDIAGLLRKEQDGAALLKQVKLEALMEWVLKRLVVSSSSVTFDPSSASA